MLESFKKGWQVSVKGGSGNFPILIVDEDSLENNSQVKCVYYDDDKSKKDISFGKHELNIICRDEGAETPKHVFGSGFFG